MSLSLKKYLLFAGVLCATVTAISFLHGGKAFAANGYFSGSYSSGVDSNGDPTWCNMLTSSCGALDAGMDSTYTDKSALESHIHDLLYNGSRQQKVSAAYIVEHMIGQGSSGSKYVDSGGNTQTVNSGSDGIAAAKADFSTWKQYVNNPAVGIMVSTYDYTTNSAYAPDISDAVRYGETSRQKALIFYNKSADPTGKLVCNSWAGSYCDSYDNVYAAIKSDCGNPVGNFRLPPPPPPNHEPDGDVKVSCTTSLTGVPTYKFSYSFYDYDGKSTARASGFISSGAYIASDTSHALSRNTDNSSPYRGDMNQYYNWSYTGTWPGYVSGTYHAVWLRVADIQPDGSHAWQTVDYVSAPDCSQSGSIDAVCSTQADGSPKYTFTYKYADANASSTDKAHAFISSGAYDADDTSHKLDSDVASTSPYKSGTATWSYTGSWPGTVNGTYHWVWVRVGNVQSGVDTYKTMDGIGVPNCEPYGRITAKSCTIVAGVPTYSVTADYADANGNNNNGSSPGYEHARAYLRSAQYSIAQANSNSALRLQYDRQDTSPYRAGTFTWTGTWPGNYDIYLAVDDVGPNVYQDAAHTSKPACPVTGGPITCNQAVGLQQSYALGSPSANITVSLNGTFTPIPASPAFSVSLINAATSLTLATYSPGVDTAASTTANLVSAPFTVTIPNATGTYYLNWQWSGQPSSGAPCRQFTVGFGPYFSVKGGDAAAGIGIGANCSNADSSARIASWNHNNQGPNDYAGGGSDLAAFASGIISNFATAQQAMPTVPKGLAFANAPLSNFTPDPPIYGGDFGTMPCDPDYYVASQTTPATTLPGGAFTLAATKPALTNFGALPNNNVEHVYTQSSDLAIGDFSSPSGVSLSAGQIITIRVNGNVYINNDITYGAYDLQHVPRLNIYASGNIFIASGVHNMHGVYVAQHSSQSISGLFATCYDTGLFAGVFGVPVGTGNDPERTRIAICNTPLTVYGAVTAEDIHLNRTYGNVYGGNGNASAAAAETFQYSPEVWLSGNSDCSTTPGGAGCDQYDTISGLPPVL